MKHPNGKIIQLDKKYHRYFVPGEKHNFTSVTSLLKKFFPKFEKKEVAKKYAKKHGLDWKDVEQGWTKLGKEAAKRGNKYHKFSEKVYEKYVQGKYEDTVSGFGSDKIENRMEKVLLNLFTKFRPLPPETVIGSFTFQLAGSVDLLMLSSYFSKEKNSLLIADWKFVKEIKETNMWERCNYPIQHFDNCNYWQYVLQLNLYSYLIKREKYFQNYTNYILKIFHVTEDNIVEIEVPDCQQDVRNMLIEWERNKNA